MIYKEADQWVKPASNHANVARKGAMMLKEEMI